MTASTSPSEKVLLEYDGPVAVISNNNPDKRNAFDDEMDLRLFEILAELSERSDVRAVIWRGIGHSFSTGRDVSAIGATMDVSHHELMRRGHRGIQKLFEIDAPIIAALQGYADAHGVSLLDVAIGALLANATVSSVIAGATRPDQVAANAAATRWRPDAPDRAQLRELLAANAV